MIQSKTSLTTCVAVLALLALMTSAPAWSAESGAQTDEIRLWPGPAPGTESWTGQEVTRDHEVPAGKIVIKTNVTVPAMTPVRPAAGKANGAAILVLPGGAFGALAWDLEGTEVAHWLADRGITAFVLKYRVGPPLGLAPGQPPPTTLDEMIKVLEPNRKIAVADATQAVRVLRERARQLGIDPNRIGMMGFSAGAVTTMGVLLEGDRSAQPNFAAPIYGMTMIANPLVPADAPPIFIAAAQDDVTVPTMGSTAIFELWTKAKRPAELHIYEKGGHGFGMRPQNRPVDYWPAAFEAWLRSHGMLDASTATPRVQQ